MKSLNNILNYIKKMNLENIIKYCQNNSASLKQCIIISLWSLLWIFGKLTLDLIIRFCIITTAIILYNKSSRALEYLFSYFNWIEKIQKRKEVFMKIIWYLTKIQKWKNPVLILIAKTDNLLYKFNRYINYILIIKKAKNKYITYKKYILFFYFFIDLIIFGIVKIILHIIYNVLWKWQIANSIYEIIIIRMYGFGIFILLYLNIFEILKQYFIENGFLGIFYIYISLIVINIMLYIITRKIQQYESFWQNKGIFKSIIYGLIINLENFIQLSLVIHSSVIWKRNSTTLIGILIDIICCCLTHSVVIDPKTQELKFKVSQRITVYQINTPSGNHVLHPVTYFVYVKNMLNTEYMETLGAGFMYLTTDFIHQWKHYKYTAAPWNDNTYLNIKNYSSCFLFRYIIHLMDDKTMLALTKVYMDMFFYEAKLKDNPQIQLNEKTSQALNMIKKFDGKRIELLLYMFYDINKEYFDEDFDEYFDFGWHENMPYIYKLYLSQKVANKLIKENEIFQQDSFYDVDENLDFFTNVFKYYSVLDYKTDPKTKKNKLHYYIGQELEDYSKIIFYISSELKWKYNNLDRYNTFKDEDLFSENINYENNIIKELRALMTATKQNWNINKGPSLIIQTFNELEKEYKNIKNTLKIDQEKIIKTYWYDTEYDIEIQVMIPIPKQ